jgi:hypothetical protein
VTVEHDIDASIRALNAVRLAIDAHATSGTGGAMIAEIASALRLPGRGPLAYAVADAIRTLAGKLLRRPPSKTRGPIFRRLSAPELAGAWRQPQAVPCRSGWRWNARRAIQMA